MLSMPFHAYHTGTSIMVISNTAATIDIHSCHTRLSLISRPARHAAATWLTSLFTCCGTAKHTRQVEGDTHQQVHCYKLGLGAIHRTEFTSSCSSVTNSSFSQHVGEVGRKERERSWGGGAGGAGGFAKGRGM